MRFNHIIPIQFTETEFLKPKANIQDAKPFESDL